LLAEAAVAALKELKLVAVAAELEVIALALLENSLDRLLLQSQYFLQHPIFFIL
jgi:hypothetical protein